MKPVSVVAALSLAVLAAGCDGHSVRAVVKPCSIRSSSFGDLPDGGVLSAELPDGSIVVGASGMRHSQLEIALRRVTSSCRSVRSFGNGGSVTLTVEDPPGGSISAMTATPDGRLLLAGTDGPHELVVRLLANGTIDRSFGSDGWARFRPAIENPFPGEPSYRLATSIAVSPSGAIFLGGDDDTAHCCTTDYVSELTPAGALVKSFGVAGTVVVPSTGSYVTELAPDPDGSVVAFAEYEQSGCGYPRIVRMRPNGSLDRRFDATIARTLKRVVPRTFRFSPSLVPGKAGAFTLVGGYDKTCGPMSRHPLSEGLALGFKPSGALDTSFGKSGESLFAAPVFTFDIPPAIRLASGEIVTVSDTVQFFQPDGSRGRSVRIARSLVPRSAGVAGVLPLAGGGAWVVAGARDEVELIPVH